MDGNQVRALRMAEGLTQRRLAERAGVPESDVFAVEQGIPIVPPARRRAIERAVRPSGADRKDRTSICIRKDTRAALNEIRHRQRHRSLDATVAFLIRCYEQQTRKT